MKSSLSIGRPLILVIALFYIASGKAQKTDKVYFNNGDILTGEIKKLDLEILQFKTSTMRTVNIKWYQVKTLVAPDKAFLVELEDGIKIFGALDTAQIPNTIRVKSGQGEFNISKEQVIKIVQVKQIFWNKFSGNFKAGVNYTKASNVLQRNVGASLRYTDESFSGYADYTGIGTTQQDTVYTAKQDFIVNVNQQVRKVEFITAFGSAQQNTELGIQLRSGAGLGYGVEALHSSILRLRGILAVTANREIGLSEVGETYNLEGLVRMDFKVFKYASPEMFVNAFANWYPSFTVDGRHRFEAELELKIELISDFYFDVSFYSNLDNRPVSETASSVDYGILSSLSYSFGL